MSISIAQFKELLGDTSTSVPDLIKAIEDLLDRSKSSTASDLASAPIELVQSIGRIVSDMLTSRVPIAIPATSPSEEDNLKLRAKAFDLLIRCCQIIRSDALGAIACEVSEACMSILRKGDSQEIALQSIKMICELHKVQKTTLEAKGHHIDLFDILVSLFQSIPAAFHNEPLATVPSPTHPIVAATKSLRILQETQALIMIIFHQQQVLGARIANELVPAMINVATVTPAPPSAPLTTTIVFRQAQVRCASLLVSFSKHISEAMKPQSEQVATSLLSIVCCSSEQLPAALRKDVLASIRSILTFGLKECLKPKIDFMIDSLRLMAGSGPESSDPNQDSAQRSSSGEPLQWHLAYSVIAEVVHAFRRTLTPSQLARAVDLFSSIPLAIGRYGSQFGGTGSSERLLAVLSSNGGDLGPVPASSHVTVVRVLLHLGDAALSWSKGGTSIEPEVKAHGRSLLSTILKSYASKMKLISLLIPDFVDEAKASSDSQKSKASKPDKTLPLPNLTFLQPFSDKEPLRDMSDCKHLLSQLLGSQAQQTNCVIKSSVQACSSFGKNCMAPHGGMGVPSHLPPGVHPGLSDEDIKEITAIFTHGLGCLKLFHLLPAASGDSSLSMKEAAEMFAEIFSSMDPRDFSEVISYRLDHLFKCLREDAELFPVVTHLLNSANVQRSFLVHLLTFLTSKKLHLISNINSKEGAITLKLFKLTFAAFTSLVNNGPSPTACHEVEALVAPLFSTLLEKIISLAVTERDCVGHLQLMRSLFKAIMAANPKLGKPVYAELLPLVSPALSTIVMMLQGPNMSNQDDLRILLLEIGLTLPAQLPNLISLMPKLMKLIVQALVSGPEDLTLMSLRTLEVWFDSVNPEFLEQSMADVTAELMHILWSLLKPGSPLGAKALIVLGKLGGRNRRFLIDQVRLISRLEHLSHLDPQCLQPPQLEYKDIPEHGLRVVLTFKPATSFLVPLDKCVQLARKGLEDQSIDVYSRLHALKFLHLCLASLMNLKLPSFETNLPSATSLQAAGSVMPAGNGAQVLITAGSIVPGMTTPAPLPSATATEIPAPATVLSDPISVDEAVGIMLDTLMKKGDEGDGYEAQVEAHFAKQKEMGIKTKAQLTAEKQVLVSLLAAVIGASSDEKLAESATPFAREVGRHYALLFSFGASTPPPAPMMSKTPSSNAAMRASGSQPGTGIVASTPAAVSAKPPAVESTPLPPPSAPIGASTPNPNAAVGAVDDDVTFMPRSLRELDVHLFIDAVVELLKDKDVKKARAALDSVSVFVDTLLSVDAARANICSSVAQDLSAMEVEQVKQVDATASEPEGVKKAETDRDVPPVIWSLLPKVLHCCFEDSWQARLAGATAIRLLTHKLPDHFLRKNSSTMLRGLLSVIRSLPVHSVVELEEVNASIAALMKKCLLNEQPRKWSSGKKPLASHVPPTETHSILRPTSLTRDPGSNSSLDSHDASIIHPRASATDAAALALPLDSLLLPMVADEAWIQATSTSMMHVAVSTNSHAQVREAAISVLRLIHEIMTTRGSQGSVANSDGYSFSSFLQPLFASLGGAAILQRRLMPYRNLDYMISSVEILTFYIRHYLPPSPPQGPQQPPDSMSQQQQQGSDASKSSNAPNSQVDLGQILVIASESLALYEKDDGGINARMASYAGGGPISSSILKLRVKLLKLFTSLLSVDMFCAAVSGDRPAPDPAGPEGTGSNGLNQEAHLAKMREDLTSLLLRALTHGHEEVHASAREALSLLMQKIKVPQKVLFTCLNPMLTGLSMSQGKLSLPFIRGLVRLLEVLGGELFSGAPIGEKIMGHLKRWSDPNELVAKGPTVASWRSGEEVEVASSLLGLFSLLAKSSASFLVTQGDRASIIQIVLELEDKLPTLLSALGNQASHSASTATSSPPSAPQPYPSPSRSIIASPYRPPLYRFISRHAPESISMLLSPKSFIDPTLVSMLVGALKSLEGKGLVEELSSERSVGEERLVQCLTLTLTLTLPVNEGGAALLNSSPTLAQAAIVRANAARVAAALCKVLQPGWLSTRPLLLNALIDQWKSYPARLTALLSSSVSASPTDEASGGDAMQVDTRVATYVAVPSQVLKEPKWLAKSLISATLPPPSLPFSLKTSTTTIPPASEPAAPISMKPLVLLLSGVNVVAPLTMSHQERVNIASSIHLECIEWQCRSYLVSDKSSNEEKKAAIMEVASLGKESLSHLNQALSQIVTPLISWVMKQHEGHPNSPSPAASSFLNDSAVVDAIFGCILIPHLSTIDAKQDQGALPAGLLVELLRVGSMLFKLLPGPLLAKHIPSCFAACERMESLLVEAWVQAHPSSSSSTLLLSSCGLLNHHLLLFASCLLATNPSGTRVSAQDKRPLALQVVEALMMRAQPVMGGEGVRRSLILEAIDTLLPALYSTQEPHGAADGGKDLSLWEEVFASIKRSLIKDDSYLIVVHSWQAVLRHQGCFFHHREQLLPTMTTLASRLFTHPTATIEHKRLSIDLVSLMMTWESQHQREALPLAPDLTDSADHLKEGGKRKIAVEDGGRPTKAIKREGVPDVTQATPPPVKGPELPAPTTTSANQDSVVSLLIRVLVSLSDIYKDEESFTQHERAKKLMSEVRSVWPAATFKIMNLDKIVDEKVKAFNIAASQGQGQGQGQGSSSRSSLPPVVPSALFILKVCLEPGSAEALQSVIVQILPILEQCFAFKSQEVVDDACFIIRTLFSPPSPPTPFSGAETNDAPAPAPPGLPFVPHSGIQLSEGSPGFTELLSLRAKAEEMVVKHLRIACSDPPPLPPSAGGAGGEAGGANAASASGSILSANPALLNSVCLALSLLEEIKMVKGSLPSSSPFEDEVATLVIKCLVKSTKELNAQAQMIAQQHSRSKGPLPINQSESPQYATLAWVVCRCLKLCCPKTLVVPDLKKLALQSLIALLASQGTKAVEPCIFLELMKLLRRWIMTPPPSPPPPPPPPPLSAEPAAPADAADQVKKEGVEPAAGGDAMAVDAPSEVKEEKVQVKGEKVEVKGEKVQVKPEPDSAPPPPPPSPPPPLAPSPHPPPAGLQNKEALLLLQRLASLDKHGMFDTPSLKVAWEKSFFGLLKELCVSPSLPNELRMDCFNKVERIFLSGLRSSNASVRSDFFDIYHSQISQTLFDRFQFIFVAQEWEAMSSQYWLKQALDLILSILKHDERTKLAPNSAQVPPLILLNNPPPPVASSSPLPPPLNAPGSTEPVGEDPAHDPAHDPAPPAPSAPMDVDQSTTLVAQRSMYEPLVPEPLVNMLRKHATFLKAYGEHKVSDMLGALMEFAQVDPQVSHNLWILIFPIVWGTLHKNQQIQLAKPIISVLSKEYHVKQAFARPNVVHSLLEGISLSQPQPKIPPELIKYIGKTFGAWNAAIPLLESHVIIFPDETRCPEALVDLYKGAGDEDAMYGLWRQKCTNDLTRASLTMIQAGQWERSQELIGEIMRQSQQGLIPPVGRNESALWVEQWVHCSSQLGNWDTLLDYSRGVDNHELSIDCMWKMSEWGGLRDLLNNKALVEDSVRNLTTKAYLALQDGDGHSCDNKMQQAISAALSKWWQLPENVSNSRIPLLHSFQQLVELKESCKIFMDLQLGVSRPSHPFKDMREIMESWRLRQPNEYEPLSYWQDLLLWRNQIHNMVVTALNGVAMEGTTQQQQLGQLGYKEKAWTVNRLASIFTLHGCTDSTLNTLSNLYGFPAMEMNEAFVKIREQSKAYLDRPQELGAGLNILNVTNLDYFTNNHQSEVFRLKGLFSQALEETEAAHTAYSASLVIWKQNPDTWLAWGQHCDRTYDQTYSVQQQHAAQVQAAQQQGLPPPPAPPTPPMSPKYYLEYATYCYLQAIRLGNPAARAMIPRLLSFLSFDNEGNHVGQHMDKHCPELPLWIWFQWIPQLLTGLQRQESPHLKPIVLALASSFPQALYYPARTLVMGMRDGAQRASAEHGRIKRQIEAIQTSSSGASSGGEAQAQAQTIAKLQSQLDQARQEVHCYEGSKELTDYIKQKHPLLVATLEHMLTEIVAKFGPKQDERLLSVFTALLQRCYKAPFSSQAEVPTSIKQEMAGVCKACLAASDGAGGPRDPSIREAFVGEMSPDGQMFPKSLGELIDRLKHWRNALQAELEEKTPSCLNLEDECRALSDLLASNPSGSCGLRGSGGYTATTGCTDPIELPGHYMHGNEVTKEGAVLLEGFGAKVWVVRRNSVTCRRLEFVGSDGHTRGMLVQSGQNWGPGPVSTDERIVQLTRQLNRLLEAYPQSRQRSLLWHAPLIVPIWPQTRLVEDQASFSCYSEAYDIHCSRNGREPDLPIISFKGKLCGPDGSMPREPDAQAEERLAAYTEVCHQLVSENIFSQYIYKSLASSNQSYVFKKQLCLQTALSGLLCQMLLIGSRHPNKILIARDTGRVYQTDMTPLYNDRGALERAEPVPFRLTRNLTTYFNSFGVEGTLATAMMNGAAAIGLPSPPSNSASASTSTSGSWGGGSSNAANILSLFFRDDISAWAARKSGKSGFTPSVNTTTLKMLVAQNVRKTLERLRTMSPSIVPEETLPMNPINAGVQELIEQAVKPSNLCKLDVTWHPWF